MALKLFDAHIYADGRAEADFANLAWFGVTHALVCAHAPRAFATARDLWQYFEALIAAEPERLGRFGIQARIAIGVHPGAVPSRAHYELWRELPFLLTLPEVAALGELSVEAEASGKALERQWELVERQARILAEAEVGLPLVFSLPRLTDTRGRVACVERLAAVAGGCGLSPSDVLVQHVDWLTIDAVEAHGFFSGLSVHPLFLGVEEAVRAILHHDRRRIVVGSALRQVPGDVLALPKLAVALAEAGVPSHEVERVIFGNAMGLFVRKSALAAGSTRGAP